jgi:DNA-binding CsgD family transcriptional regulator
MDEHILVGAIYDAALDSSKWRDCIIAIGRELGADFVMVTSGDIFTEELNVEAQSPDRRDWTDGYIEHYRRVRWFLLPLLRKLNVGQVFCAESMLTPALLHNSLFWEQWMAPNRMVDALGVVIESADGYWAFFVAFRTGRVGPVDKSAMDALAFLTPHMVRARTIQRRLSADQTLRNATDELLDHLRFPVIFVDRRLRLLRANTAARKLIADADVLMSVDGVISAVDTETADSLERAVVARGDTGCAPARRSFLLRGDTERHHVAHVLRVGGPDADGAPVAAIVVRSVGKGEVETSGEIAPLFSLTAREISVLRSITDLGGIPSTAHSLGLAEGTVKGYLKNIFAKTGARRQSDLVKIVDALETPYLEHVISNL